MKNLTLILEPTQASLDRNDTEVSAWNPRARGWTTVPEWIGFYDEAGIAEIRQQSHGTYNEIWLTMRVATKEEVIGFMLANPERDWD
jgi:hypothetical protein